MNSNIQLVTNECFNQPNCMDYYINKLSLDHNKYFHSWLDIDRYIKSKLNENV